MKLWQEFKAFVNRGNVVDLAIGVVIGAAFGKIVSSLVADIITPVLGLLIAGVNFTSLTIDLQGVGDKPISIHYGNFLQTIFDFLIVSFAIFAVIKFVNRLQRKQEAQKPAPTPSQEEILLTEIRDILKQK